MVILQDAPSWPRLLAVRSHSKKRSHGTQTEKLNITPVNQKNPLERLNIKR